MFLESHIFKYVASVSPLSNIATTRVCERASYTYAVNNLKEVWSIPQTPPHLCAKECALRFSCHSWHHDGHQTCFLHKTEPRSGVGPHAKDVQYGLQAQYVSKQYVILAMYERSMNTRYLEIKMCELAMMYKYFFKYTFS